MMIVMENYQDLRKIIANKRATLSLAEKEVTFIKQELLPCQELSDLLTGFYYVLARAQSALTNLQDKIAENPDANEDLQNAIVSEKSTVTLLEDLTRHAAQTLTDRDKISNYHLENHERDRNYIAEETERFNDFYVNFIENRAAVEAALARADYPAAAQLFYQLPPYPWNEKLVRSRPEGFECTCSGGRELARRLTDTVKWYQETKNEKIPAEYLLEAEKNNSAQNLDKIHAELNGQIKHLQEFLAQSSPGHYDHNWYSQCIERIERLQRAAGRLAQESETFRTAETALKTISCPLPSGGRPVNRQQVIEPFSAVRNF